MKFGANTHTTAQAFLIKSVTQPALPCVPITLSGSTLGCPGKLTLVLFNMV